MYMTYWLESGILQLNKSILFSELRSYIYKSKVNIGYVDYWHISIFWCQAMSHLLKSKKLYTLISNMYTLIHNYSSLSLFHRYNLFVEILFDLVSELRLLILSNLLTTGDLTLCYIFYFVCNN